MKAARTGFQTMLLGMLLIVLGAVAGWWWGQDASRPRSGTPTSADTEERTVLYWYDPMSPQNHFDKPGKSPYMDMDLLPKYASANATDNYAATDIKIDARVTQNIGLRETVVERIALASVIEATGLIAFNERDVSLEQARSGGLVEQVWPLAPGDVVKAGQPLVDVLIPEWSAAQAEFLVLRTNADETLVDAARERLRLLGMSADLINELDKTGRARSRFTLRSSRAGVLESLDVRSGMTVTPGQMLARIQGIDNVWLEVAVPENRTSEVQVGGPAQVHLAAYPGQTFNGQITAVLPTLTAASRTLRVRIELPNPLHQLRAGMSAQVRLVSEGDGLALAVPTEAIIRTGKRALVIAVLDGGSFAPIEVQLGREINNSTVITAGLQEGQKIVASAQFLLDSEASLSGVFPRTVTTGSSPRPELPDAESIEAIGVKP